MAASPSFLRGHVPASAPDPARSAADLRSSIPLLYVKFNKGAGVDIKIPLYEIFQITDGGVGIPSERFAACRLRMRISFVRNGYDDRLAGS
ncbi:unnamed protein product, partial [Iphiclides podalirius]